MSTTISLTDIAVATAVMWVLIVIVAGCAILASRQRDRRAEARISASHRALVEAEAQRAHVDELVQSIEANRHKVGRE